MEAIADSNGDKQIALLPEGLCLGFLSYNCLQLQSHSKKHAHEDKRDTKDYFLGRK